MGTTAQKLQAILNSKAAIKTAIENNGVTVGNAELSDYPNKINEIPDGLNGFLSVTSKTVPTSPTQTTNMAYNKKCGILDENGKEWDVLDWHQRWVDNGYSATGLSKPTGLWMDAFGLHIKLLWPLTSDVSYSDVSGTVALVNNAFAHFVYNINAITAATAANRTVWPCNQSGMKGHGVAGKYNDDTWYAQNKGDGLEIYCENTNEVFYIPSRDVGNANAFVKDNNEDYMESHYVQCEFLRALFAICSGIRTNEPDGTVTEVEILNSNGEQAAVGEDMYFWVDGTNTGLKAKYNLNCLVSASSNVTTGLLTQAISDAIYDKQVAAGINMNDTGVNSASKHILPEGCKGAEAIAVDGYWYIKTPFISNPNGTTFNANNNMPDAPAAYICKKRGVSLPTERELYPYYLNRTTVVTAAINLLRTTEGLSADVPAAVAASCWSAVRYNATGAWFVNTSSGSCFNLTTYSRYTLLPCPLASAALDSEA